MNRTIFAAGVLALALGWAGAASAHHSYAMFENDKEVTISGTITKWSWANPHSFLEVMVATPAGDQHWEIESTSPSMLARIGLTRNTFVPGDKVAVKIHPRRDGTYGGSLMSATLGNGTVIAVALPRTGGQALGAN